MVNPAELVGVFHCHHIPDIFDNTHNSMVAFWIGTYGANLLVRNISACFAINHLIPHFYYGISQSFYLSPIATKQV
jgi:hypothetical protein